jgi:protein-tyrosine phosphatase
VTKPTKLTLGIGAAGIVCGLAAGIAPFPWDWLWAWVSFSCFLAAGAYAANRPEVLGKSEGRITAFAALPALPYLVAMRIACALMRWHRRFPPLSRIEDELWVGGRFLATELPPRTALIVDLTAESSAPARLRAHPGYRNLPVLDGSIPADDTAVLALLDEIAATPGPVVIHCDSGVGRAPTFAILALLRRGLASDVDAALARVKSARPMSRPTSVDLRYLARISPRVIAAAGSRDDLRATARAARAVGA